MSARPQRGGRRSRLVVSESGDDSVARPSIPPLENGDHLTRAEYERRYEASPEDVKAELIDGVVYMSSPTRKTSRGPAAARTSRTTTTSSERRS